MTILLVDDDADDRKLFFEVAKEVDDTILCIPASSGEAALLYLRDQANPLPDYIFLDLNMPMINGKQCLKQIRKF